MLVPMGRMNLQMCLFGPHNVKMFDAELWFSVAQEIEFSIETF